MILGDTMLFRVFLFLLGFGLTLIGMIYVISYLNLLTMGYNFLEYVNFIIRKVECMYTVIGFILIYISIYNLKGEEYVLHIWYNFKF